MLLNHTDYILDSCSIVLIKLEPHKMFIEHKLHALDPEEDGFLYSN